MIGAKRLMMTSQAVPIPADHIFHFSGILSGQNMVDDVGAYNATKTGAGVLSVVDGAYSLSQAVLCKTAAITQLNATTTYEVLSFKMKNEGSTGGTQQLVWLRGVAPAATEYHLTVWKNSLTTTLRVFFGDNAGNVYSDFGSVFTNNVECTVKVVYDGNEAVANNRIKLYVDGVQKTRTAGAGAFPASMPANNNVICNMFGPTYQATGTFDDIFFTVTRP